ncbi:MAG: RusA family crossover junction endodeoxyribonuclease [Phycisphaerales bacterium]|nr:MAG: RusA family crossover junction endodeoxyribonuclease [Phycisphaerales bacterium]
MLRLTLPWPPSVNRAWRTVPVPVRGRGPKRGFRVVLSREGRAYRRDVAARLSGRRAAGLTGRLSVSVDLHPPSRRPTDIDNRLKLLLDALQHAGVYRDDGQIDAIAVRRCDVRSGGLAVVEIEERCHGAA